MKTHHIITDGWSQALLGNRISETYLALLQGKEPELEPLDSYLVHVNKEQEYLPPGLSKRQGLLGRRRWPSFRSLAP